MDRLDSNTYQNDLKEICEEKLPFEKLKNSHILVTGATGLIGSCLVDTFMYLKSKKQISLKLDIFCRNKKKAEKIFQKYIEDKDFSIIEGDLTKEIILEQEYDYIIHGAGNNHPVAFAKEPVETMKASIMGTIHLLDTLVKQNNKKSTFLFLSTGEVYGNVIEKKENGCKEDDIGIINPVHIRSCYPEGKRAAETLCISYAAEYDIDVKIGRLSYIYGATYQQESSKADVQFLKKAVAGEDIVMKSAGMQYRSYCYLTDAISGILHILLKGKQGEVYNISNNKSNVTIRQFAETLAKVAGVKVVFENPKDVEQRGYSMLGKEILDSRKLEELGYQARINLKEAFVKILCIKRERGLL